jgi:hypothetical protein
LLPQAMEVAQRAFELVLTVPACMHGSEDAHKLGFGEAGEMSDDAIDFLDHRPA